MRAGFELRTGMANPKPGLGEAPVKGAYHSFLLLGFAQEGHHIDRQIHRPLVLGKEEAALGDRLGRVETPEDHVGEQRS